MIALGGGAVLAGPTRTTFARSAFTRAARGGAGSRLAAGEQRGRHVRSRSRRTPSTRSTASGCRCTRRSPTRTPTTPTASCSPRRGSTSGSARSICSRSSSRGAAPSRSSPTRMWPGSTASPRSSRSASATRRSTRSHPGEPAKAIAVLERLWRSLRIGRDGTIVAPRRRLHDRRRRLRRGDLHARRAWVGGPDDARRPGRRGDRRQDGRRPAGRQEPRRCLPLARARRRSTRARSRLCPTPSIGTGWPRS